MDLETIENKAALLDALPECVFLIGQDHKILTVNATVGTMLAADASSMKGQALRDAMSLLVDSDGHPLDIEASVDRCLAHGEAELLDAWLKPGAGSTATLDTELNKISVTIMQISSGDHSDKVAMVVSGKAVRQPYALRDAVLSMVSHELRTPLLHIKGFVSTLLESDIQWDEETRLDFLHTIDREADRLTFMVNDLMEITRMGSVDLPLHLEDADPYLLAYAAFDSASMFVRKHRVLVEIPENLPKINIDVLRVMGVLTNLIQNASKYSEAGSRIVIDAETDDSAVTFSVTDEGAGIPEHTRDRIFNMFFRGEDVSKQSPGSGLGLAVCKSVVDAHGGKIWVESEIGVGSTFKFTIPFKQTKTKATTPEKKRKATKAGAKRTASSNEPVKSTPARSGKVTGGNSTAKRNGRVVVAH